ncbi:hypothetical protein AB0O76_26355 [Streptomyces sp. NPDC086554]|uniref:hypothetical protein n=1 Tax=Streptomyces sp. NPDC086554 TaxID=3154864 RepID=UPI0034471F23
MLAAGGVVLLMEGMALGMAVAALVAVPFGVAESGTALIQESLLWSQWIAVLCVMAASAGAARGTRPDL